MLPRFIYFPFCLFEAVYPAPLARPFFKGLLSGHAIAEISPAASHPYAFAAADSEISFSFGAGRQMK